MDKQKQLLLQLLLGQMTHHVVMQEPHIQVMISNQLIFQIWVIEVLMSTNKVIQCPEEKFASKGIIVSKDTLHKLLKLKIQQIKMDGFIVVIQVLFFQMDALKSLTERKTYLNFLKENILSQTNQRTNLLKVLSFNKFLCMETAYKTMLQPSLFLKKKFLRNGLKITRLTLVIMKNF